MYNFLENNFFIYNGILILAHLILLFSTFLVYTLYDSIMKKTAPAIFRIPIVITYLLFTSPFLVVRMIIPQFETLMNTVMQGPKDLFGDGGINVNKFSAAILYAFLIFILLANLIIFNICYPVYIAGTYGFTFVMEYLEQNNII